MARMTIVLGNKNYSSWSLRPWLALKQTGALFEEVVIPLDLPDTRARILEHSPSGRVPVLKDGDLRIWESLAIVEYLAEQHPEAGLWPATREARAVARSICAEMHAGFQAMRQELPMDIRNRQPRWPRSEACERDIARVLALWDDCRSRFGGGGDFLFGEFSAADAFYAPVVTRMLTYEVPLAERATGYCQAVMNHPPMQEWVRAARDEPWTIERP